ncbi:MAG: carbohydrate kinase family protein [Anaerolineales bacterium]|nr:carbohydrate kinase family protein [Anaerolineales bacterium]
MNTNPSCDVLLFGDYFCDLIITGLQEVPRLGADVFGEAMEIAPGGAYILTVALHRLGARVRWAARFGNDLFSRFMLEQVACEGLDTSLFQHIPAPLRSLSVSFSFAHDRGFISYVDEFPPHALQTVIGAQRPRWVINTPFSGEPEFHALAKFVHAQGTRLYTDCQYTTQTLDDPGLTDLLRLTDIFAPNQSEACQLTGESDPERAAARLAEYCPLVLVKCGADGALARSGNQTWHSPALKVDVVDTTGAGDSFNAGFLAAHLRGESIETCLRWGNICGGLSTTRRGGTTAAPTLEQLESLLA